MHNANLCEFDTVTCAIAEERKRLEATYTEQASKFATNLKDHSRLRGKKHMYEMCSPVLPQLRETIVPHMHEEFDTWEADNYPDAQPPLY